MTLATTVRKALYGDVKRRFIDNERDGHLEDLLVSTILDPRFKLMSFESVCYMLVLLQGSIYSLISTLVSGCTHDMKMNAERWLKDNYNSDWDWDPKTPQNGNNATKKAAFQQCPKPSKPNV